MPSNWYAKGLRFGCHGCGSCCRVHGYVWIDDADLERLAEHLGGSAAAVRRRYLRRVGRRHSLIEHANGDCVFWKNGCEIYEARPKQCRTFPFWPENLATEDAWRRVAADCPGCDSGRAYTAEEITRLGSRRGATEDGPARSCCEQPED